MSSMFSVLWLSGLALGKTLLNVFDNSGIVATIF